MVILLHHLSILSTKIHSIVIQQNNKIKGITVGTKEHKISHYADDTSLILNGLPIIHYLHLQILQNIIINISGWKINSLNHMDWLKKILNQVFHHTRQKLVLGSTTFSLTILTYSCSLLGERRAVTTPRQRTFFNWAQLNPASFASDSADLLQVCLVPIQCMSCDVFLGFTCTQSGLVHLSRDHCQQGRGRRRRR